MTDSVTDNFKSRDASAYKKGPEPHLMQNITWHETFTVYPLFCKLSNPCCYRKWVSASEIRLKMTGNSCCVIQSIKNMNILNVFRG